MKNKHRKKNIILSVILLLLYTATYLLAPVMNWKITLLDYAAAAGTITGICIALSWMPAAYYYTLALFACVAQYFGMMFNFYQHFKSFDLLLHFFSGLMLTVFGYYLYTLFTKKGKNTAPLIVPILFAVFFAISAAAVWEIYEFLTDTFFGLSAQGVGVKDTMTDIIAGSASAVICGAGLAVKLKKYPSKPQEK